MKHPHYIVAILKEAFGPLEPGINPMLFGTFFERAQKSLFIGRRHELEENENFGQMLPYVVLKQGDKVFAYQRTKKVGEQRLAGMSSVGIGGHIDLIDVFFQVDSIIDIMATLARALTRELAEEIGFKTHDGETTALKELRDGGINLTPEFRGIINDTSDPVGRVHYGVLFTMEIPPEFEPYCLEEELTGRGLIDISALQTEVLENWSNLVLKFLKP